jgi:hypothetical protein
MRRVFGGLGALLSVALAAGCGGEPDQPDPEEMSREKARAIVREVAAEAVRKQFGVLPEPQREYETHCDSAGLYDDERFYVAHGVWDLPMPAGEPAVVLRAFHDGAGQYRPMWTTLGDGRFAVDGRDREKQVSITVRSGDSPDVLRVWAGSACLRDPD